ncbi:MAG TPA: NifB/NifX family molybdenum-iron cluster-binding protein [Spirochaetota bacterium]|nr:NifB/NifX family molybdenum-iron cluster-binding protein [Spirochaetota bacterium]
MKIAISARSASLESNFDTRFGRAPLFVIYDTDSKEVSSCNNTQNLQAAQGAGIQTAQNVANAGAQAVVSGHCGPKAFTVLTAAGVTVYQAKAATVQDVIRQFENGELVAMNSADVEGHWV